jgi:hypothetical protein
MLFLITLILLVALAELLPERQTNSTSRLRAVVAFSYLGFIWLMIVLAIAKLLIVALKSARRLFSNS